MKNKKYIVDTTLRDGEQSAGIAFDEKDKVKLAKLMDEIGIYQIEAGIPAIGNVEKRALLKIMENRKNALISAWNRMNVEDIKHSIECSPDIIHISAPVSYVQIYSKLRKNKQWLRNSLMECVYYALDKGYKVTVGFEDASRADISFIVSLGVMLKEMGVSHIRYADTVGVLTPHNIADVTRTIIRLTEMDVEIHGHNDFGMAVANSLEAAKNGAKYIDCTFLGIGERAGNCDFIKFIKSSDSILDCGISKKEALEVQKEVYSLLKS
ncbi:MAG: isopropylmalate/homocitrate/citramalate synthase [Clostridia bacterium]|jgi:homocitrate synthase NifV|nr:isopropylmalate/homocitrate/citramalate synthase [Clostridia bacterium]